MLFTVYSGAGCSACTLLKRLLDKAGVVYEELPAEALPEHIKAEAKHLPVFTVGADWWSGFIPEYIDEAISLWKGKNGARSSE